MDSFYDTILLVALVLLILGLVYSGYILYHYKDAGENWPKSKSACPDSWIETGKDENGKQTCMIGYETKNTGKNDFVSSDPSNTTYSKIGEQSIYTYDSSGKFIFEPLSECDLKVWADLNDITWDGVTNYNNC